MEMQEYARRVEDIQNKLFQTAVLWLGDPSAAEEALDEAVYRGLKGCKRLREPQFFNTWMTRILMNVCNDEQKRRKREQSWEVLPETAVEAFDALPLREAIRRLPKELKALVILRYFSGFSLREASELLEIPQGTAATRERRALRLLRLELKEEEQI
ncbi:MAG: sigma-70 family RNA polymerase sigma factor [Oscillospiraceae bacterium]|nr:sigma-70 family RNA polymerase sigma factor [Oscillospiraceae bacterium]